MENAAILVKLAKKGDREAFGKLYELYYSDFYKYALYMLKKPEDASDAVSDAVFAAYKNIHKLKKSESFKSWVLTILSRLIFKQYKKVKCTELPEISDGGSVADIGDLHADLCAALSVLDKTDRAIVILSVCYDYTSREIGDMLGMNHDTVRSRRARAAHKLREILSA